MEFLNSEEDPEDRQFQSKPSDKIGALKQFIFMGFYNLTRQNIISTPMYMLIMIIDTAQMGSISLRLAEYSFFFPEEGSVTNVVLGIMGVTPLSTTNMSLNYVLLGISLSLLLAVGCIFVVTQIQGEGQPSNAYQFVAKIIGCVLILISSILMPFFLTLVFVQIEGSIFQNNNSGSLVSQIACISLAVLIFIILLFFVSLKCIFFTDKRPSSNLPWACEEIIPRFLQAGKKVMYAASSCFIENHLLILLATIYGIFTDYFYLQSIYRKGVPQTIVRNILHIFKCFLEAMLSVEAILHTSLGVIMQNNACFVIFIISSLCLSIVILKIWKHTTILSYGKILGLPDTEETELLVYCVQLR